MGLSVSIPCIPPQFQAALKYIYLALLFYTNDRKEFGNLAVFNILIQEIKYLQTHGIEINIDTKSEKIYFDVGLILGDNLGLHSIVGMTESFSGNFT